MWNVNLTNRLLWGSYSELRNSSTWKIFFNFSWKKSICSISLRNKSVWKDLSSSGCRNKLSGCVIHKACQQNGIFSTCIRSWFSFHFQEIVFKIYSLYCVIPLEFQLKSRDFCAWCCTWNRKIVLTSDFCEEGQGYWQSETKKPLNNSAQWDKK